MPWSSGGLFTRVHNWGDDLTNQVKITATRHDAEDDNLAAGIDDCLHKDGRNAGNPQFAYFINNGSAVAVLTTQAAMTALDMTASESPTVVYLKDDTNAIWEWDSASTDAEVTDEIQQADAGGTGRWHRRDTRGTMSQAVAEGGTDTTVYSVTALRLRQATQGALDDDLTIAGNHAFTGNLTMAGTLGISGLVTLSSTDAGAAAISTEFYRNSASAAVNDITWQHLWTGNDDAGTPNKRTYASDRVEIEDPTTTAEYGRRVFAIMVNGTLTDVMTLDKDGLTMASGFVVQQYAGATLYSPSTVLTGTAVDATTATATLTVDEMPTGTKKAVYRLKDLEVDTDDTVVYLQVLVASTAQTSSYNGTGNSVYRGNNSNSYSHSTAATSLTIIADAAATISMGNAANETLSGEIWIMDPLNTTAYKWIHWELYFITADGEQSHIRGCGRWEGGTSALSGIKLLCEGAAEFDAGEIEPFFHI